MNHKTFFSITIAALIIIGAIIYHRIQPEIEQLSHSMGNIQIYKRRSYTIYAPCKESPILRLKRINKNRDLEQKNTLYGLIE